MTAIDKAILDTNENICKNIKNIDASERGFLSQNILSQLRNLIEDIAIKLCSSNPDVNPNNYQERKRLLDILKSRGDLKLLYKLHKLLQITASHYTLNEDSSERLMIKYFEYLIKIKKLLNDRFNISILENIEDFPIDTDKDMIEFYQKISEKIDNYRLGAEPLYCKDRLYIQKIKPFFVKGKIYYEVSFTLAADNVSKFDRVIAFTSQDIVANYAVNLIIHKDSINIINNTMEILIIDSWMPSIRQCELNNFNFIFHGNRNLKSIPKAYDELMKFIHDTKMNLLDLIESSDDFYNSVKTSIFEHSNNSALFELFDDCRDIILYERPGANLLRYLLFTMRNTIIKNQINWNETCSKLSNLYFEWGAKPFDEMPFAMSPKGHNPKISDLLDCFNTSGREDEFLARFIRNNTEHNNILFTKSNDLDKFSDLDNLINKYNGKLYYKHRPRGEINKKLNVVFINEFADDCSFIIKRLQDLSSVGIKNYTNSVINWLNTNPNIIDDETKKRALLDMFANSRVAMIYGSAGTGKSTLINHVSTFLSSRSKLFLANTNPAVDNLKRKIKVLNSCFMTIAKFLSNRITNTDYDIIFIDECSTVSNSDMKDVLQKAKFKLLVLVGDIYQIEAIQFGNWFELTRQFVPATSVFELTNTFRSSDENLKKVWSRVRNLEDSMQDAIDKFGYTKRLDNSIFEKSDADEIILCLNYDGLYGINNINSFMQNNNKNKSIMLGVKTFKIGDPVLFNENNRFSPVIYNNMKGIIRNFREDESSVIFDIEIDTILNELDVIDYDFQLLENSENGNSIIRFYVEKEIDTDNDNSNTNMPFQIAYAVSIHKAQGLEYNSVKIIISDECEEKITHNIFYTAITRARKNLQIYWSPEVEHRILSSFKKKDANQRDSYILKSLYSL
ncbi:MAG: ATP-dependent RecD-like DNA helicase [Treponema sp.]|nr:ATP-dependent RecD-like DNA helicase [Treponema sp.]